MDENARKEMFRTAFDAASEGYDRPALRFFHHSARLQADHMALTGGERVLDVATGTGALALELAGRLPNGRVTGIDLSSGMLARARAKAAEAGLANLHLQAMDMTALEFPPESFDAVGCAFGIFFIEDMQGQLRHMAERLRQGGRITLSSFGHDLFHPMVDLFMERIETYGVKIPNLSWKKLDEEEKFAALFESAGMTGFRFERHEIGYRLEEPAQWWDIVWYAGFRGLVNQLDAEALERFKGEHLEEVARLADGDGLPLPIETLYASGERA